MEFCGKIYVKQFSNRRTSQTTATPQKAYQKKPVTGIWHFHLEIINRTLALFVQAKAEEIIASVEPWTRALSW